MKQARAKTRSIIQLGESLAITLPREFIRKAGLSKGDTVAIAYDSLFIIVNPNIPKGVSEYGTGHSRFSQE